MRINAPPAPAHEPGAVANDGNRADQNRKLKILCAEDHEMTCELLQKMLTDAGYEVECAFDGKAAWKRLSAAPSSFDVLITDHQMPGMNGLALVAKLRQTAFSGRIIVYSGALTSGIIREYLELGVDHIAHKPYGPAFVVGLLADAS